MRFLRKFHSQRVFPRGCNSSFISLISKFGDPQHLGKFRPISLVGCMYKILAKVLPNRMKGVFSKVIDQRQSMFLGEKYLFHSALVVNEVIDEAKRLKKCYLFFKIDYEKAYDSVN